jgi:hypothetical protein
MLFEVLGDVLEVGDWRDLLGFEGCQLRNELAEMLVERFGLLLR